MVLGALLIPVDLEARRLKLARAEPADLPALSTVLLRRGYLLGAEVRSIRLEVRETLDENQVRCRLAEGVDGLLRAMGQVDLETEALEDLPRREGFASRLVDQQ